VSKISDWAKLFAYFLGIPLAIILFILGFLGYNSYSSFTSLIAESEKKLRPQIQHAKITVDSLKIEAEYLQQSLARYKELDSQISELTKTVNKIAEKFNIKGVSESKRAYIQNALDNFQTYITALGYNPVGKEVHVSIDGSLDAMGSICYYESNTNT